MFLYVYLLISIPASVPLVLYLPSYHPLNLPIHLTSPLSSLTAYCFALYLSPSYLRKNPMIRWNAVKRWCRQILRGLEFLHTQHVIHRDIKCDNIFINGATGDLRIGDLGLSTKISEHGLAASLDRPITAVAMTCLGTPGPSYALLYFLSIWFRIRWLPITVYSLTLKILSDDVQFRTYLTW